jgi:hypothetical protein
MTWSLLHLARMLRDAGGIPAHGNQRGGWEAGCRFGYGNPDHRSGGTGTAMTMDVPAVTGRGTTADSAGKVPRTGRSSG